MRDDLEPFYRVCCTLAKAKPYLHFNGDDHKVMSTARGGMEGLDIFITDPRDTVTSALLVQRNPIQRSTLRLPS